MPKNHIVLQWEPVFVPPGRMFVWDSTIPHRNLKNSSKKTCRIVYYYSCYRQEKDYHKSDKFMVIKEGFKQLLPFHTKESLERRYLKEEYKSPYVINNDYTKFKTQSTLLKSLYGFDRNTYENVYWN